MNSKSLSFRLFLVMLLISAISFAMLQLPACKQAGGTCTYEGLECPNAYFQYQNDSAYIADLEELVDSLTDANDSLHMVISGYEMQNHSRIPIGTFTVVTVDTTVPHWQQYANFINHVVYE